MARASTTSDAFNAIAEPRRRDIIDLLVRGGSDGLAVGSMVTTLNLPQPTVSKHLAVLRQVGIVAMSKRGRERIYRLNPEQLQPVRDWVKAFDQLWTHQLDRIKLRAERSALERATHSTRPPGTK